MRISQQQNQLFFRGRLEFNLDQPHSKGIQRIFVQKSREQIDGFCHFHHFVLFVRELHRFTHFSHDLSVGYKTYSRI